MNSIPAELKVYILSYLPGKDVKRFERLNQHFASLMQRNRNFLPKPTVSLMIGGYYKEWELVFTVTHGKTIIPCHVLENGKIKLSRKLPGANRFLLRFYDFAQKQPYGCAQKSVFFKWLLKNFDLEFIEFEINGKWDDVADLFAESIEESRFKCPKVCLKREFVISDPYERRLQKISIFQKLCDHQRKFGAKTQLVITDEEGNLSHQIREFICIDHLRKFSRWFDDVLCEFNYDTMIVIFNAICSRWNRGFLNPGNLTYLPRWRFGNVDSPAEMKPLDNLNFRVRLFYDKQKNSVTLSTIRESLIRFFNLNQTLVNLTKEEFLDLLKFESFDKLPEEIVCRRIPEGKFLKFKFAKEEKSVVLTVELD